MGRWVGSGMDERKDARGRGKDWGLWLGLVALVTGLGALVVWALPEDTRPPSVRSGEAPPAVEAGTGGTEAPRRTGELERPFQALCELAVLTAAKEGEVQALASAQAVASKLDARHCGAACDAVRKVVLDPEQFEIEVLGAEEYVLPPKESFDTVAAGLTPQERASIDERRRVVVIRTRGPATVDQLPARAAYAATALVADGLSGLVYDEVSRRIENAAQHRAHAITVPLGEPVFTPRHIVVQLYRQDDGTARLLTLGMIRFGSPDFTVRGATMNVGPALANVMNAVAARVVAGKGALPLTVTLDDVARVSGKKPEELAASPATSSPVHLEVVTPERVAGDPENEMAELVPPGGATTEAWAGVVRALFGAAPEVVLASFDAELDAIGARARRELPGALRRFEAGKGRLFVKGPFPIPEGDRGDGGPRDEWMWLEVSSCDARACSGALSNAPAYATNLAAGKPAKVDRERIADWLLRLPDGGAEGGESIRVLERRGAP